MAKVTISRTLRRKMRVLMTKWAEAEKAYFDYSAAQDTNKRYSNAKEQRLFERSMNAEDRMYPVAAQLPMGARDNPDFKSVCAIMAVGTVMDNGYDPNSLQNWSEAVEENMVEEFLERRAAWHV